MQQPKGDVRPIFPAGAVVRYRNPAHQDIAIDDFPWVQNHGSLTRSTPQDRNILDEPRLAALRTFLEDCVRDVLDHVYGYDYEDFAIIHAWLNRAPEGGWQRMHYHGNSVLSGVYYLAADPKTSAPLIFEKPEINSAPYIAIAAKEQTIFTANRIAYPSETGICYLFPSQIKHGYDTPSRGGERISLAFNVMLSGVGLFYRI